MSNKKITLSIALAAVFSSSVAFAEAEVTGKIVHESANFTNSGSTIGAESAHGTDSFKQETTARIFIDGDATDNATYHVELQGFTDGKANGDFKNNENYTQRDALREAYIDTETNGFSIRAGKQQVVWGTADGMKLLDAINPTDYSEMAQNQMEDSRIPVWMINAEKDLETGGSMQFILSEGKSSHFAGMGNESSTAKGSSALNGSADTITEHTNGDTGHAFIMKGADTITGKKNGFLNVSQALGGVAQAFDRGALTKDLNQDGTEEAAAHQYVTLQGYTTASVNDFAIGLNIVNALGGGGKNQSKGFSGFCTAGATATSSQTTSAECLADVANNALAPNGGNYGANNQGAQNLISNGHATSSNAWWEAEKLNPTSMFPYMKDATFATFDNFVNMKSQYVVDHGSRPTLGWRFKDSTKEGVNYSFNITNGPDTNPFVDMKWTNDAGAALTETVTSATGPGYTNGTSGATSTLTYYTMHLQVAGAAAGTNSVGGATILGGAGALTTNTVGSASLTYTASNTAGAPTDHANLVMTEKLNPITQIGGSFDMAIETEAFGPVVLRGEALYQKNVMSPVVIREAADGKDLSHGFLTTAVKMVPGDRFKYVLGADITAMTNMMVSAQFIQDMNLDYVDRGSYGSGDWTYTADMATMSLTNNLNKGEENKEFYSLFLSKPFGASGEHRWNNIFMFEENGGKWNRLDAEFSIDDDTQATVEYNKYWGDANTQFGQLEKSSNIQVGFKYSF